MAQEETRHFERKAEALARQLDIIKNASEEREVNLAYNEEQCKKYEAKVDRERATLFKWRGQQEKDLKRKCGEIEAMALQGVVDGEYPQWDKKIHKKCDDKLKQERRDSQEQQQKAREYRKKSDAEKSK